MREPSLTLSRSARTLDRFAREYGDARERSRYGLRISIGDSGKFYSVTALGSVRDQGYLIVTAPENENRELIAVLKGQTLTCRWFNATTAFRFRATIAKVGFEPIPLLYLELPERIERSEVRQLPRALANIRARVRAAWQAEAVVVDLSLGGARIAVADDLQVQKGSSIELLMWPRVLDQDYLLRLPCTVTGVLGNCERKYPDIHFYGLHFNEVGDQDLLVLHAHVQSCLATEFDWLTQALNRAV
jgi:c-di-GMP-binding flagellar brake protein YcgR